MSHIFISHAWEDKPDHVRPLVEVLIAEGEPIWIDRPGVGEGNLGLEQAFISRHDIDYLGSGNSWSENVRSALRQSGAVLACVSRALAGHREVLVGEITVAHAMDKLVTCIVDDMEFSELPSLTHGLLDASRLHALRINTACLSRALEIRAKTGCEVARLPAELAEEWEKVRTLIAHVDQVRTEPRRMRAGDLRRLLPLVAALPIGPVLKLADVPLELIQTLGDHVNTPARAHALLMQANQLAGEATEDASLASKLRLREGALPPVASTSPDNYWTQVFHLAGVTARRCVGALLLNPVADWAFAQSGHGDIRLEFLTGLGLQVDVVLERSRGAS